MLEKFVFLVKNLRGVLAALPGEDLVDVVAWLSRKFRYRDLGVPGCLVESEPSVFKGRLGGKPFHVLEYPTRSVEEKASMVCNILSKTSLNECLARSLTLASCYACPILATQRALEELESRGLVVHVVRGPKLSEGDARLHLRIADYSVLDAYVESIQEATESIASGSSPTELLNTRKKKAERDSKRYWRIAGKGEHIVVAYVDYVHKLLELDEKRTKELAKGESRTLTAMLVAFNLGCVGEK